MENKEYKYSMLSRPFGIGTYPPENFIRFEKDQSGNGLFGFLFYSEPITLERADHFSLIPITEVQGYHNREGILDFDGGYPIKVTVSENSFQAKVTTYVEGKEVDTETMNCWYFLRKVKKGDYIFNQI